MSSASPLCAHPPQSRLCPGTGRPGRRRQDRWRRRHDRGAGTENKTGRSQDEKRTEHTASLFVVSEGWMNEHQRIVSWFSVGWGGLLAAECGRLGRMPAAAGRGEFARHFTLSRYPCRKDPGSLPGDEASGKGRPSRKGGSSGKGSRTLCLYVMRVPGRPGRRRPWCRGGRPG
jgi:hypothetical protein